MRLYEDLIVAGDRSAIWRFYAFENNLIEEDPSKLLDPRQIVETGLHDQLTFDYLHESKAVLCGDPDEVTRAAKEYEAAGVDLMRTITRAFSKASLVIVAASATYGQQTTSGFSTYEEMNFVQIKKILVKLSLLTM